MDALGQSVGFGCFHLLLFRADGKLLLASGCWGGSSFVGWQGIPSKMGWRAQQNNPRLPQSTLGSWAAFGTKLKFIFKVLKATALM